MLNLKVGLSKNLVLGHMRGESSIEVTGIARAACRFGPLLAIPRTMPEQFVAKWTVGKCSEITSRFSGTAQAVRCDEPEGLRPAATFQMRKLFLTVSLPRSMKEAEDDRIPIPADR